MYSRIPPRAATPPRGRAMRRLGEEDLSGLALGGVRDRRRGGARARCAFSCAQRLAAADAGQRPLGPPWACFGTISCCLCCCWPRQ